VTSFTSLRGHSYKRAEVDRTSTRSPCNHFPGIASRPLNLWRKALWAMQLFPCRLNRPGDVFPKSAKPPTGQGAKRGRLLPPSSSAFWPALIGGTLIVFTFVVLADHSAGAVTYSATFPASEDTYIKNTRPMTNYGQDTTLQADMEPSIKRALIRFSVTGLPSNATIQSATLRLYVVDESNQSGSIQRVNGPWSENTTTWNNAPAVGQQVAIIAAIPPRARRGRDGSASRRSCDPSRDPGDQRRDGRWPSARPSPQLRLR